MTDKLVFVWLATGCVCLFCLGPVRAEAADDYWPPWVTQTATNSAVVNWRGESNGVGFVDYAAEDYYNLHHGYQGTVTALTAASYQHIQLPALDPDTPYVYRVRPSGKEHAFSNRAFRTMPTSGPFTFIVISDSQEGHYYSETQRFAYVAAAVAKETNVLFILHGGDYAGYDYEPVWTTFVHVADRMLATSAVFPTIGNHEYHNHKGLTNGPTAAEHYHGAYGLPLNYAFDCAGIRFVVLNSPDPTAAIEGDPQTSLALAQSQAGWLAEQLNNTLSGTFTIHHHPIWDAGHTNINSDLAPWESVYHAYPISANFSGHAHNYQRYMVKGIPYFILGDAGGKFIDLAPPFADTYQTGITRRLGYLKVKVDPANNTATAQEILVASVETNDSSETPHVFDPPVLFDQITFPLKPSSWSEGAMDLGGGWRWLSWFNCFADAGSGWIYHGEHGWMFSSSPSSGNIWFWTPDMAWLWTRADAYPYLFRAQDSSWLWYQAGTGNPRYFYNFTTGSWETY